MHKHQACQVKFMLIIRAIPSLGVYLAKALAPKKCDPAGSHTRLVRCSHVRCGSPATSASDVGGGCWLRAPEALGAKDRRCKELSDMLFGPKQRGRLRQSAGLSQGACLSPRGDNLSFCCELAATCWLQARRTWCVGDIG